MIDMIMWWGAALAVATVALILTGVYVFGNAHIERIENQLLRDLGRERSSGRRAR